MKNNILIVIDNISFNWKDFFKYTYNANNSYYLFSVGFDSDHSISDIKYNDRYISDYINIVDVNDNYKSDEEEARNTYLRLVRDFPTFRLYKGQSVYDILQYQDVNLWWYLQITEKSIWVSKMVHRLYAYYRFKKIFVKYDIYSVNLHISDLVLTEMYQNFLNSKNIYSKKNTNILLKFKYTYLYILLKYFRNTIYYVTYNIITNFILAFTKTNHFSSKNIGSIGIFSIYPCWWNNVSTINPTDMFFNDVPDLLKKIRPVKYLVLLSGFSNIILSIKNINFLRKDKFVIINKYLTVSDILSIINPLLIRKILVIKNIANKKALLFVDGLDFSILVKDEIIESLIDPTLFRNILLDKALRHIDFNNFSIMLYRLEFQTLERPLVANSRNKTKSIGLQHSAMSDNFLNYVFTEDELKFQHLDNIKYSLPLPDLVLTCGWLAYKYFIFAGFSKNRLFVVGGVRFKNLLKLTKLKYSKKQLRTLYNINIKPKIIFIPMSQLLFENIALIKDLILAVGALNSPYHIVIKINPAKINDKDFIEQITKLILPKNKLITMELFDDKNDYHDYLCLSDVVLLTGGSVAFESVILGVPPIVYICYSQFSHNPMTKYPSSVFIVQNSESLSKALVDINNLEIKNNKKENFDKPIRDIFGDINLSPKTELINKISNYLN